MLTTNELRRIAARSGARQIAYVEIDVILTHLLQLFHERALFEHLVFKGGTMLRKMIFGKRGRLSTDLDFTLGSSIRRDDLMLKLLEALSEPYRGLTFNVGNDNDWYLADDSCGVNPLCIHTDNATGARIKLQVSLREHPILATLPKKQLSQEYFEALDFVPADIASLAFEEALAEKLRAASQRSKIRDLHDLSESLNIDFDKGLVRGLAVLKMWNQGDSLSYATLASRVTSAKDYDVGDLTQLLRKDQRVELATLTKRVVEGFKFLGNLSEIEARLVQDKERKESDCATQLIEQLREWKAGIDA
jgi:predicted nucleotidyltransferase component of viral defense system